MESKTDGGSASVTSEELAAIEDEEVLNKMLDNTTDFEERRMLRAALRDLLKKKRDKREQDRGSRQQDLRQQGLSKGGTTGGAVSIGRASMNQQPPTNKPSGQLSPSADSKASPAVASAQKCPGAAPNVKNVKQMLLDWCRAKTEPYEGVDIQNFSSSWRDGIAFCALVHRFFPDAFEYSILNPNKPRDNFQLAFSTAERLAGCPPLLDADDLVRMKEPDWKCVYTYIQEFYRCLVEKGLVKTKKRV
ncbi:smoothelin-like protein 1 [Epinephelus lanceolatus]|uniref:smoothelin n=1 Tax=Epinephelus lanceolatus TaxID=310571 RepID=UPI00144802FB|nr:smoothelin [Epinephelus lanceolatus]XP_033503386.1 smoothelin [Epinephelus lanceolatus]XP_033503387.1 smoothelin [Epinephelus lanceolatus]